MHFRLSASTPPGAGPDAPTGQDTDQETGQKSGEDAGRDKRAARQRRILEAAIACFARDGFHGTSMQKICTEAGMSPGALYRYFPSKEAIIAAIVQEERADRLNCFLEVSQQPNIIVALVETLAVMLREADLPTACLGPEIMAEAIRNTTLREAIEPEEETTRALLRETLAMAVGRGEIAPELDLNDAIILLQIMADGAVLYHQLHPEWNLPERLPRLATLVNRMFAPCPASETLTAETP